MLYMKWLLHTQGMLFWLLLHFENSARLMFMLVLSILCFITIFLVYFSCELLYEANEEAEDAFYFEVQWYQLTPQDRKILLLLMTRSKVSLKAGGIYPMTLDGFMDVLKAVHSNCVVLQNLLNKF